MEIWKDIKAFEGFYQVSNLGNVQSLDRYVLNHSGGKSLLKSQPLKQTVNNKGYYYVSLYKDAKGVKKSVHQLVAESFLNHTSNRYTKVVDHINNDATDNRVENLRVISHRKNVSRPMPNKSGFRGVHKSGRGFKAIIRLNGKRYHLGTFDTAKEASEAYQYALNNSTHKANS